MFFFIYYRLVELKALEDNFSDFYERIGDLQSILGILQKFFRENQPTILSETSEKSYS
jgi:hypothetical protein